MFDPELDRLVDRFAVAARSRFRGSVGGRKTDRHVAVRVLVVDGTRADPDGDLAAGLIDLRRSFQLDVDVRQVIVRDRHAGGARQGRDVVAPRPVRIVRVQDGQIAGGHRQRRNLSELVVGHVPAIAQAVDRIDDCVSNLRRVIADCGRERLRPSLPCEGAGSRNTTVVVLVGCRTKGPGGGFGGSMHTRRNVEPTVQAEFQAHLRSELALATDRYSPAGHVPCVHVPVPSSPAAFSASAG